MSYPGTKIKTGSKYTTGIIFHVKFSVAQICVLQIYLCWKRWQKLCISKAIKMSIAKKMLSCHVNVKFKINFFLFLRYCLTVACHISSVVLLFALWSSPYYQQVARWLMWAAKKKKRGHISHGQPCKTLTSYIFSLKLHSWDELTAKLGTQRTFKFVIMKDLKRFCQR